MSRPAVSLSLAIAFAAASSTAYGQWPPSFEFGDWTLKPSASVQYDSLHADVDDGDDLHADFFRRQRFGFTLESAGGHRLKAEYDFASGTWNDVFLGFSLGDAGTLRVGQVKPPIGLEVLSSHRTVALLERSPASGLLPGRRLGVEWSKSSGGATFALAAISDNLDDAARGHGVFGRATRQFGADPAASRFHVGVGAGVEWPDSSQRLRGRPDVNELPLAIADSGSFDADRVLRVAAEGAWDHGPVTLQAEHVELRGDRDGADVDGRGGYLMASWRPTGEARRFRDGILDTLKPEGPWGAFELVARFGWLEVDTADGADSSGDSVSAGANWYINPSVRLMTQLTSADSTQHDGRDRIYGARLHFMF
jgi:phosphate-selective porin OprO/OprP